MAEISKFNVGGTVYDFQDKVSQYGCENLFIGTAMDTTPKSLKSLN